MLVFVPPIRCPQTPIVIHRLSIDCVPVLCYPLHMTSTNFAMQSPFYRQGNGAIEALTVRLCHSLKRVLCANFTWRATRGKQKGLAVCTCCVCGGSSYNTQLRMPSTCEMNEETVLLCSAKCYSAVEERDEELSVTQRILKDFLLSGKISQIIYADIPEQINRIKMILIQYNIPSVV